MRPTAPLLLLLALAFAACGGSDKQVHGVDTSDPEAVVEAIVGAVYNCGEEGDGLEYDLILPSQRDVSREQAIRAQQRRGCRPERVPQFDAIEQLKSGDRISYEISRAGDDEGGRIVAIETDDGWRLDAEASEFSR